MDNIEAFNNNLQLTFCIAETKYLGEKGQSAEQQRLLLSRLLHCLCQPNVTVNPKQAEELFFQITKVFQQQNQHIHALATQIIERIRANVKSAFFVTRSLVMTYEKEPALQPQSLRLLGAVSNQSSLADVTKLVRLAILDFKNQRLVSAGALASFQQKIQIDFQTLEKVSGPGSFLIAQNIQQEKAVQLTIKQQNPYSIVSVVQNLMLQQIEERKKFQTYLQFLPSSGKDYMYEKNVAYLSVISAIAVLSYATLKPQLSALFQSFCTIYNKLDKDYLQIAFLRQILKVYSIAVSNNCGQSELQPINNLLAQQTTSTNQIVQTLTTIHLITSTKDPQTIVKLSNLLPSLTGELKESALELIVQLSTQIQLYTYLIPILQQFLKSQDTQIRKCGFQAISNIIQLTDNRSHKYQLTRQLIENFDDQNNDASMTKQICDQLSQLDVDDEKEAQQLAVSLWQRCILDNMQVRLASIQALNKLAKKFQQLQKILDLVVSIQNDGFVNEVLIERDSQYLNKSETVQKFEFFNMEDIINNAESICNNNYSKIIFNKQKVVQQQNNSQAAVQEQLIQQKKLKDDIIQLNKNYKQYKQIFTNSQYQQISQQSDDVQVDVCKVYYINQDKVQALFHFKCSVDKSLKISECVLKIGKKSHTFDEKNQLIYIQDYTDVSDCQLEKLKLQYVLEDEEDEILLQDIFTQTVDLVSDEPVNNYVEIFNAGQEDLCKYTLGELNSLDDVIDSLPTTTGLRMEELVVSGKSCSFWLVGQILQVGEAVVKCECRTLKGGGVGAKLDFRGRAGLLIKELFE